MQHNRHVLPNAMGTPSCADVGFPCSSTIVLVLRLQYTISPSHATPLEPSLPNAKRLLSHVQLASAHAAATGQCFIGLIDYARASNAMHALARFNLRGSWYYLHRLQP